MADPSTCSAPAPAAPDLPTRNSPHTSPSPEHTTLLPTPPSPPAGSGGKSKTQVYNCDATDTPVYNTRDKGGALSCADCKQAPEKAHKVALSLLTRPLPLPSTESLPTVPGRFRAGAGYGGERRDRAQTSVGGPHRGAGERGRPPAASAPRALRNQPVEGPPAHGREGAAQSAGVGRTRLRFRALVYAELPAHCLPVVCKLNQT